MGLDPTRTVAELEELRELTGDENGAQRVAWTDTWQIARECLRGKLEGTTYYASVVPDGAGVAGAVATPADIPFNVPLRIHNLNPSWPAGIWRGSPWRSSPT